MTKVVLVTGGSRGIGAATALACARAGFHVGVVYREQADAAAGVVAACLAEGVEAVAVPADVAVEADVLRAFAAVTDRLGPLTALVNNAGVVAPRSRVDGLDADRIERMLRVNVLSAFLCAREAVRRMSTAHGGSGGSIVNVSSRAAALENTTGAPSTNPPAVIGRARASFTGASSSARGDAHGLWRKWPMFVSAFELQHCSIARAQ